MYHNTSPAIDLVRSLLIMLRVHLYIKVHLGSTEKLPSLLLLLEEVEEITSCLSYQNSLMHLGCKTATSFNMHFSFTAVGFYDGLYQILCIVCKRIVENSFQIRKKIWGPRSKKWADKILRIVSLFCDLVGDLWQCRMPSIFITKNEGLSGLRTRPSKYIERTSGWWYSSTLSVSAVRRCCACDKFLESVQGSKSTLKWFKSCFRRLNIPVESTLRACRRIT